MRNQRDCSDHIGDLPSFHGRLVTRRGISVGQPELRPRTVRGSAMRKLNVEVVRVAPNGTQVGFKFAERMFEALPELKKA